MKKGSTGWLKLISGMAAVLAPLPLWSQSWQPVAPRLEISHSTTGVALSWPVSPVASTLEISTQELANWASGTGAVDFSEENIIKTVQPTNPHEFYRLRTPESVPLFHFEMFYAVDMEVSLGASLDFTGSLHGNSNIYFTGVPMIFNSHVTAAGTLSEGSSPLDPIVREVWPLSFLGGQRSGVRPLNLPFGTNASAEVLRQIVEIPPIAEDSNSGMGPYRYFNLTDIIIIVSNNIVAVRTGAFDNFATAIPANSFSVFLRTNVTFYDAREQTSIIATEIDVAKLRLWSLTNQALFGRELSSIYISDNRTNSPTQLAAVRLINGQRLPPLGLTVATPNPLYVEGDYNISTNGSVFTRGSTNTENTLPASLVADAITILSSNWNDAKSTSSLNSRIAGNTTVNAAFLGGIVPSDGTYSSGGIYNFPRHLENWSGKTFAWNGSMAVLFNSTRATMPWGGPNVYIPPTRTWNFDQNFLSLSKLPPCTLLVGEVDP